MECAFYPVWESKIPLYDGEIYDTVFVIEQGKAKVKNLKTHVVRRNHCRMQSHVSSLCTYVTEDNSKIEQRLISFLFNRIIF